MENQNSEQPKFLGMKRDALIVAGAIFAPNLVVWVVVLVALFGVTNANINRLNDTVANLAAQTAAQTAAIEAVHADVRELGDSLDALSEAFFELKVIFVPIHGRLDSIERRPPVIDSGDDGLDDLANPSK